ncbi:hypothetical protein F4778DRAFT_267239 [Xylariomycetidae sp. FL2044]|nr:hypothetical protein F4778DRAFT_267239 [Xylariomycetidae sp. FL2044]
MHIPTLLTLSALALINALPQPELDSHDASSPPTNLTSRDDGVSYDSKGSGMCGALQIKYCDQAVNRYIYRDDQVRYTPASHGMCNGGCSALGAEGLQGSGCSVFVDGPQYDCDVSGNQLWWDYQDIRANGVEKCGSKHWGNGCRTTVNYVAACFKAKQECNPLN